MSDRAARSAPSPLWALVVLALPAPAAPQDPPAVVETQRVTAFDLLVELRRPREPRKSVEPPADLALEELTVLWDGEPLRLVGMARADRDPEAWRLVIYIDRSLASNHTIRWAAMELAERVDRLTALGEVEVVVADPEPRRALAPTRDARLLDGALSGVFLAPAGTADLIVRREDYLLAHPRGPPAGSGLGGRAADAERRLVGRQTDRLLDWLVESEPPTSRRAVLLVGDGWDLRPDEFYGRSGSSPARGLAAEADTLAETLAAYGWIVAPVAPPAPPVGTGRFGAFVLPDVTFPWLYAIKLRSLEVWLDGNRAPKKADALSELGNSLRAAGRLERAAETYRQAIYHYYDHPKTARRQAAALVALGETLELLGDPSGARTAFRTATAFDPVLESRFPFAAAGLRAPREPLERLAELTAGSVVPDTRALETLLASLERRLRLTVQLAGSPDGSMHRLTVGLRRPGLQPRSPPVARWGTPPEVIELRLRQLLDGEPTLGTLELVVSPPETGRSEVELRLATGPAGLADPAAELLVSWASAGPGTAPRYRTRAATLAAGRRITLPVEPSPRHSWLAVVVEEVGSGAWGGAAVEPPKG